MIQVFSEEFTVDKLSEAALTTFIEDHCKLTLYKTDRGTCYFTGKREEWLIYIDILKQDADNLNIEVGDYYFLDVDEVLPTDYSLVGVDFKTVLSKLIKSEVIYYEFSLTNHRMEGTKVTPNGKPETKSRYLTFW